MHEAVLEDHLHQHAEPQAGDPLGIRTRGRGGEDLGPLDEGHGEDPLGRQGLDHLGEDDVGVGAEVLAEAAVVGRLDAEIELGEDGPPELVDGGHRRQRGDRGDHVEQPGPLPHHHQVEAGHLAQLPLAGQPQQDQQGQVDHRGPHHDHAQRQRVQVQDLIQWTHPASRGSPGHARV